jgi:AcrR family transcriptional regulator
MTTRPSVGERTPRRAVAPDSERVAATRARLLDAAEELFLVHDPATVSVRTINAAAGLNPGAVHYHFGSKHGLVLALLENRLTARLGVLGHLAQLEKAEHVSARAVVALAVDPLLTLASGSEQERLWVRLLVSAVRRDPASTFAQDTFSPTRWEALICRALPHVAPEVATERWRYTVVLLLAVVSSRPDRDMLIDFLTGGLTAP